MDETSAFLQNEKSTIPVDGNPFLQPADLPTIPQEDTTTSAHNDELDGNRKNSTARMTNNDDNDQVEPSARKQSKEQCPTEPELLEVEELE